MCWKSSSWRSTSLLLMVLLLVFNRTQSTSEMSSSTSFLWLVIECLIVCCCCNGNKLLIKLGLPDFLFTGSPCKISRILVEGRLLRTPPLEMFSSLLTASPTGSPSSFKMVMWLASSELFSGYKENKIEDNSVKLNNNRKILLNTKWITGVFPGNLMFN